MSESLSVPKKLSKSKEDKLFKDIMKAYKRQYDQNQYYRERHDEDLEYYQGYRNHNDYPLVYNESHNRILPIIYTILSRFMDQLYQSGNIISVAPRKGRDVQRAKAVEGVLNYQMETLNDIDMQGGSYVTMMKWMFNAITFGKGIAKCYWHKEERISPKRIDIPVPKFVNGRFVGTEMIDNISQEMQTVYNGPYVEVIHNKLFVPDTEYKNIQQMPMCFLIYRKTMDYCRGMQKKGIYTNINKLGTESGGGAGKESSDTREAFVKSLGIEGALHYDSHMGGRDEDSTSPYVDILECHVKAILDDEPYTVGSGVQIKGREKEYIVHIGNYKEILSVRENTGGVRPLFDIGCYMQPELYWDLGMVNLTKGLQEQINNLANLRLQNAYMLINPMLKVNVDSDIDPQALVWKPFGIVPVESNDDIEPLIIPDTNSNLFMEQEMFYKNTIQDIMGMYDYNMGQTPQRQERVGVVYGIQAMGEARSKLLLMSMDYLGIRPLLKYMMMLNTMYLPNGFEYRIGSGEEQKFGRIFGGDIHPDFDFSARYTAMEPALGKQARADRLVQMAGLWAQNPWINQRQFHKTIMELMDVREAEQLIKTPQQMQEEQQQAAQQAAQQQQMALQAEKLKQQFETEGKLRVSDKDFKEELTVNEQEFGFDMALEGVKQEADKGEK